MNFETVFYTVQAIVLQVSDPAAGWRELVALAQSQVGPGGVATLTALDFAADVRHIRTQLADIVSEAPVPESIDTLFFGLFDAWIEDSDDEEIGFYVSGVQGFDPDDPDTLVDPLWFPENRFLDSQALREIKACADAHSTSRDFLEYGVALGAATLLARFAAPVRTPSLRIVVGFDDGDYLVLPTTAPN